MCPSCIIFIRLGYIIYNLFYNNSQQTHVNHLVSEQNLNSKVIREIQFSSSFRMNVALETQIQVELHMIPIYNFAINYFKLNSTNIVLHVSLMRNSQVFSIRV